MANNTIVLNGNAAPFVDDEFDAGEADITPGHALDLDPNGDVVKHSQESDTNQEGVGAGLFADVNEFDPSMGKNDAYPTGERVKAQYVPVGGKVDAFLAAGGDLSDSTRANVGPDDVLEQVSGGALAAYDGSDTTGDGTGSVTETVYESGALYKPLEAVDNSGAAAGEQTRIKVVRIA